MCERETLDRQRKGQLELGMAGHRDWQNLNASNDCSLKWRQSP